MPVLSRGGKASAMSATVKSPMPEKPLLETPTQNAATKHGRDGMSGQVRKGAVQALEAVYNAAIPASNGV